jgi:Zn-dependent protease
VSAALVGLPFYQDPEYGGVGFFAGWMAAAFVSLVIHALGHLLAARFIGVRVRLSVGGLGDRVLGGEGLGRWRRLGVLLAGPLASFLVVGVVWAIPFAPFPAFLRERGWASPVATGLVVLSWINLWWGLLSLLPLWPLDGGQAACEAGEGLLGRRGVSLALLLSVAITGCLTLWVLLDARLHLLDRFDPRYRLQFTNYCVLLVYCFAFWAAGFRALWGDTGGEGV